MAKDLKTIEGVEIFSAGTWNGDTYTVADLDEMVRAFSDTSKTWKPFLKLGHDDNQALLQADGYPAAGWIGKLYRAGEKLVADFVDIPEKIYELIQNRAYRTVSSEIYWNIEVNGSKYPYVLGAVALLGADLPAVQNLAGILSMYGICAPEKIKIYENLANDGIVKTYLLERADDGEHFLEGESMPEKTAAELKLELELKAKEENEKALEEKATKLAADLEAKEKYAAELEAKVKANEEEKQKAQEAAEKAQRAEYLTKLESEKLITPAMKPLVEALIGGEPEGEKKEYSVKLKSDAEAKKFTKQELIKEVLKLHSASSVNVEESSEDGDSKSATDEKAQLEKVNAYAKEHGVDFAKAYKAVMGKKA